MDTPLDESNLAHIGSDEDKAAREAAASFEVNWEGAGENPGVQIWRVENRRDDNDNPVFGINIWPKTRHGEFYRGDSYIVLQTTKVPDASSLQWDLYFWIGSNSSQDEYGVAAYKANELDDLLGDAPVQHREVEGIESEGFTNCFPKGIKYLDGGISSGFRDVDVDEGSILEVPTRLMQVHKQGRVVRSFQVPVTYESLNDGDSFLLDCGKTIYTWFGAESSGFERNKVGEMAHNMSQSRHGYSVVEPDVGMENESFWEALGGKGNVKPASSFTDDQVPAQEVHMYSISHEGGGLGIKQIAPSAGSLNTNDVFIVDSGPKVFLWVGKGSSKDESQQAMLIVDKHLRANGRTKTAAVSRILEGQEKRGGIFEVLK